MKDSHLVIGGQGSLEGFGIATVEALSCGTLVLGTPVGATPEILGPLSPELLFRGTDPSALSELIIEFVLHPWRIEALRPKCREYAVRNYSWEGVSGSLETVYQGLLAEEGSSGL